jgi:eukaryotic-like serine/threonine-protein kinase
MIGLTLSGRYELLARVGGGGMALVYKARDLLLNRFVAVKVLRQQFTHDDDFIKRFRREAQAAASLSHPNIVSIFDVGQVEDTHYIVMEYVEGANLNEIIQERAPLQPDEAVKIASQICDALEHAHFNQIIHRDIKPHNILIGNNGRVKVTDFGIARAVTSATITQMGSVVGSVHYFSPEHAKGVMTGEKSDLYSLGIVLYQMLTGKLPFLGESPISVALKHLQEPFEQPRLVNPHIPQSLENIILKAMRKNPQERYQSALEMHRDLETCLQPSRQQEPMARFSSDEDEDGERTRVIPAIRPEMRSSIDTTATKSFEPENRWNSEGLEPKKKRWGVPVALSVLALVLIGVLVWAVMSLKSPANVNVPLVVGESLEAATQKLEEVGLKVDETVLEEASDKFAKGLVVKQSKQDMEVKEGSIIRLTVSTGKDLPEMPKLEGKSYEDAVALLKDLGVSEEQIDSNEIFDESDPETVLKQSPATGELFDPAEDTIELTVSKGREAFPMPDLIGKTENEAKAILMQKNLKLSEDKITRAPSYKPKGTVFKQFPAEQNEMVTEDTEVAIWVSSGYPADSRQQTYDVTVAPAQEGQESTIVIRYSDARGDNIELAPRKITTTTQIPVTLVLSPDKGGQIMIYRDGEFLQSYPIPYQDIPAGGLPDPEASDAPADPGNSPAPSDDTDQGVPSDNPQ